MKQMIRNFSTRKS